MRYFCCDERRRSAVRATGVLNGIEFLEVVDSEAAVPADRQRVLEVHLLLPPSPALLAIGGVNVRIDGGVRVRGIVVDPVVAWDGEVLTVRVSSPGDFSRYTLAVVDDDGQPHPALDPLLAAVDFSFKIECPTDFDCVDERGCPAEPDDAPEIDYLARDYASFRRLMLDRMAVTMPDWRERNPADLGVALVEVLAYVADHLSWRLDAVGMEATLATARRRSSVRRLARLVDYHMHDGANARAWLCVEVAGDDVELPAGTPLLTAVPGLASRVTPDSDEHARALREHATVFETMQPARLHQAHNRIALYAWGDRECCLPVGAIRATLSGALDRLAPGDVLIFEERVGPRTGAAGDADPAHRHAVRLTRVTITEDPIGSFFANPAAPVAAVAVTEVEWSIEDALPFPLCVSSITSAGVFVPEVSVAHGNVVLADHGRTIADQPLPPVPASDPRLAIAVAGLHCDPGEPIPAPVRYRPRLPEGPVTMAVTTGRVLPGGDRCAVERVDPLAPAARVHDRDDRRVLPVACLVEQGSGLVWAPRRDLLASDPFAADFVVDLAPDGAAELRFGDDEYGMRPREGAVMHATWRVGNGTAGNVGADALRHVVTNDARVVSVTNPLPARGGSDPEPIEHVRRTAPYAFRVQQRAVTPADYAEVTARHPLVQRAVATERWTGSWYTIFLTVDRRGGLPVDREFEDEIRRHLERYRMAGHDVEIDGPRYVPLEIELHVCVLPDYYRGDVRRAILDVLSAGARADGQPGFFHSDAFSFGQPVYLSALYAAVQAVPGVRFVEVTVFQRLGDARSSALDSGVLTTGRLEIARLDNDPNFPERGSLRIEMEGGR